MNMRFVDSHCHLDFPELAARLDDILAAMADHQVVAALCAGVNLENFDRLCQLVQAHDHLLGSVAVHPGYDDVEEPTVDALVKRAQDPKIVAIGETGLDYHYHKGDLTWQRERFRTHIRAAKAVNKPLIIHCREAADDVIQLLKEEHAETVGGIMHCFSENETVAQQAMELGFYISFSGVITFKNAEPLRQVVRSVPLDRLLIETDSPYLAPVPYRGKTNEPAYVTYVARQIAQLKELPIERVANQTTDNFCQLFRLPSLA